MLWKPITAREVCNSMAVRIAPQLVIFSGLDGRFLDYHSYAFGEPLSAFHECLSAAVPIIFCSSKTRAEIQPLLRELGGPGPLIPDNGGAVFPRSYFPFPFDFHFGVNGYGVILLGSRYAALTLTLDALSRGLRIPIRAVHQMTPLQIAEETGFADSKAELAWVREYDEPFTFCKGTTRDVDRLQRAVELLGLRCTTGGQRWHSCAEPDGEYDPAVLHALPGVQRSPLPGPRGWTVSVGHLLADLPDSQRNLAGPISSGAERTPACYESNV